MISGDTQTAAFSFFWIFPAWPGLLQLKASVSAQEIDNALAQGAEAAQGAPLLDAMSSSVHASSVALPWVRYTLLTRSFCVIWQRAMRPTLQSTRRRRPLWVTQGEFLITHLCRPCVFWLACFKFDSAELMARASRAVQVGAKLGSANAGSWSRGEGGGAPQPGSFRPAVWSLSACRQDEGPRALEVHGALRVSAAAQVFWQ